MKNSKIEEISEEAQLDIEKDTNPKKRCEMILETRRIEKEGFSRPQTGVPSNHNLSMISRLKTSRAISATQRPLTGKSSTNQSTFVRTSNAFNRPGQIIITDPEEARKFKGKLLISKYTNAQGIIDIGPISYDSYFIEVLESNEFMGIGMTLSFNAIYSEEMTIKKYLGLYIQENAFIQLHVYENKKNAEGREDQVHIPKSKVTLKTVRNDNVDQYWDEKESKIKLDEKREGIFEHTVAPGRYLLEVHKDNYDDLRKFIDLEKGLNSVNVEMVTEKNCNLKISVFNYEKFEQECYEPIQNVEIVIYKNSNEVLSEGITDKKGELTYLITKNEDSLSIVVNKLSYFPAQRMFIRNMNAPVNEKGENEERKPYCDLNCYDGQKDYGVLSTYIKYKPENEEEKQINDDESENIEEFEEILRWSLNICNDDLKNPSHQDKGCTMNGWERFCCQCIIYTPNNTFFLPGPSYCQPGYNVWDWGWLDIKNLFFYETNILCVKIPERSLYLSHWIDFLQQVLYQKIYKKLFEFFTFDKGILMNSDRFVFEQVFIKQWNALNFCEENEMDIKHFICDSMKNINTLVSFSQLKKKIASNLRNFKEDINYSKNISTCESNRNNMNGQ